MKLLIANRQKLQKLDLRRIRKFLQRLFDELALGDCELSVSFVDNATIQEINRLYLNRDKPTNVISFSLREGEFGDINPQLLGDIIISVEKAREDAQQAGLDYQEEIDFLLMHGLLHLLGYDHEDAGAVAAEKMQQKERELFLAIKGISLESE